MARLLLADLEFGTPGDEREAKGEKRISVKLIVGLGNPGIEYQFTPHNLGFLAIDRIANGLGIEVRNRQCRALTARVSIGETPVVLAKPETYMNLSGLSVRELVAEHQVEVKSDLIVIYDELDLPFGTMRIKQRGGTAGHNGMESILGALGTDEFLQDSAWDWAGPQGERRCEIRSDAVSQSAGGSCGRDARRGSAGG